MSMRSFCAYANRIFLKRANRPLPCRYLLQEGAVLITNDRHFDKINDEKIIEVWSISKAIKELKYEPSKF